MFKIGDKFIWHGGEVRVMVVVEGYLMVRKKRAMPFVVCAKDVTSLRDMFHAGTAIKAIK